MLASMDAKKIPVTVRMRVDCAACGHHEDETYELVRYEDPTYCSCWSFRRC